MYCICCNQNNVIPHEYNRKEAHNPISEEDILCKNEKSQDGKNRTINNDMVSGGIIQIIEAGYGSKHDGDQIILAICDECISNKLDEGTLLYFGNYMGFYDTEEEIEKSKRTYRRRKNLDNLI